jgi:hypothetical protein
MASLRSLGPGFAEVYGRMSEQRSIGSSILSPVNPFIAEIVVRNLLENMYLLAT